jgi:hypothetical protein
MRAAPAFQVSLRHFGVWRACIGGLAAMGLASMAAWAAARDPSFGWPVSAMLVAGGFWFLAVVISLLRTPPVSLRWDGSVWYLGEPETGAVDMTAGDLRVIIDLGPWMLLRFATTLPNGRTLATWLPVQRRGLEAKWHGLRCSVYSPRPLPGETLAKP